MIQSFSPLTRKFLALALLFFAIMAALSLVILPVVSEVRSSLDGLADARFRLARLDAIKARPEPKIANEVPQGATILAADAARAMDQFRGQVVGAAASHQVQLVSILPLGANGAQPRLMALQLVVSGSEHQVLTLVNSLEQGRPLIRLKTWTINREEQSAVPAVPLAQPGLAMPAMPTTPSAPTPSLPVNGSIQEGAATPAPAAAPQHLPLVPNASGDTSHIRLDAVLIAVWEGA